MKKSFLILLIISILLTLSCDKGIPVEGNPNTVTDIDGNVYTTVTIGTQTWTVENLRVTHYYDGTPITNATDNSTWANNTTGAYSYYNNTTNADSIRKFGVLYNWHAVNTGKLATDGWHIPTNEEWSKLEHYLVSNGYNFDGSTDTILINLAAKSLAATTDWSRIGLEGVVGNYLPSNNSTGFSALPGGYRLSGGVCASIGDHGFWWSTTEYTATTAICRYISYQGVSLYWYSNTKEYGHSVRLVKD